MLALLRRTTTEHRLAALLAVATAAVAATVLGVLVAVLLLDGDPSEPPAATEPGEQGGSGGGGRPSARLLSVFDSLPLYPGATVSNPPVSTGIELRTSYWVKDSPEQVITFHVRELPKAGWQPEAPPTVTTSEKGGQTSTLHSAAFVKDDLRLTISAWPNTKDPDRGASGLAIDIRPR